MGRSDDFPLPTLGLLADSRNCRYAAVALARRMHRLDPFTAGARVAKRKSTRTTRGKAGHTLAGSILPPVPGRHVPRVEPDFHTGVAQPRRNPLHDRRVTSIMREEDVEAIGRSAVGDHRVNCPYPGQMQGDRSGRNRASPLVDQTNPSSPCLVATARRRTIRMGRVRLPRPLRHRTDTRDP